MTRENPSELREFISDPFHTRRTIRAAVIGSLPCALVILKDGLGGTMPLHAVASLGTCNFLMGAILRRKHAEIPVQHELVVPLFGAWMIYPLMGLPFRHVVIPIEWVPILLTIFLVAGLVFALESATDLALFGTLGLIASSLFLSKSRTYDIMQASASTLFILLTLVSALLTFYALNKSLGGPVGWILGSMSGEKIVFGHVALEGLWTLAAILLAARILLSVSRKLNLKAMVIGGVIVFIGTVLGFHAQIVGSILLIVGILIMGIGAVSQDDCHSQSE